MLLFIINLKDLITITVKNIPDILITVLLSTNISIINDLMYLKNGPTTGVRILKKPNQSKQDQGLHSPSSAY